MGPRRSRRSPQMASQSRQCCARRRRRRAGNRIVQTSRRPGRRTGSGRFQAETLPRATSRFDGHWRADSPCTGTSSRARTNARHPTTSSRGSERRRSHASGLRWTPSGPGSRRIPGRAFSSISPGPISRRGKTPGAAPCRKLHRSQIRSPTFPPSAATPFPARKTFPTAGQSHDRR